MLSKALPRGEAALMSCAQPFAMASELSSSTFLPMSVPLLRLQHEPPSRDCTLASSQVAQCYLSRTSPSKTPVLLGKLSRAGGGKVPNEGLCGH